MDFERLRNDLIDYYGSAMFSGFPMAMIDVSDVERMTDEELVREAEKIGLKLSKYQTQMKKMIREEIIEALEQYYEAAGFEDVGKRKLEEMSENELEKLYKTMFREDSKDDEIQF